jgi:UDP-galactopyranose mutase
MSDDQHAGRSHNIKTDNSYFKRVEEFKYLGTNVTNQNSIQEEIKNKLKSGNACYHSVHSVLSSSLLSKSLKIKIYRTIVLPCVVWVWNLIADIEGET